MDVPFSPTASRTAATRIRDTRKRVTEIKAAYDREALRISHEE